MEGAYGEVMEAAAGEALAEIIKGLDAFMGAGLGFLEFLDGLVPALVFEVEEAEIEAELEIVRVFVGELPAAGQFVLLAFGDEVGPRCVGLGGVGIELGDLLVVAAKGGLGDGAFEAGFGHAVHGEDAAVEIECGIEFVALEMEVGDGTEESGIIGLLFETGEVIGEQFRGGVLVFDFAIFLFEGNGLVLVFEDVAVGAGAALEGVVALAQGAIGGDVFEGLGDRRVVGEGLGQVAQDGFGALDLAGEGESPAELEGGVAVGGVFENDLEREDGGFGKVDGQRGIGEEPVCGEAMGVAVQDLFSGDEGITGISAEFVLSLGEGRGVAGGAEHFLEETALFAGALELRGAEGFAASVEARFLAEDGVEQSDGVIEVLAFDGGDAFFVLLAQWAGNCWQLLLGHGWSLTNWWRSAIPKSVHRIRGNISWCRRIIGTTTVR